MHLFTLQRLAASTQGYVTRVEVHHVNEEGYCIKAWHRRHRKPFINRRRLNLKDAKALVAEVVFSNHRLRGPRGVNPTRRGKLEPSSKLSEWDPHEWAQVR